MPKQLQDDTISVQVTTVLYGALMYDTTKTNTAKLPTGAGVVCAGIAQDAVAGTSSIPKNCRIRRRGITKAIAKAAIAIGDPVSIAEATTGKVHTAVTTENQIGYALTAAAADGDIFELSLEGQSIKA